MNNILVDFWKWIGKRPDEYAKWGSGEQEEFMYPKWDELILVGKEIVLSEAIAEDELDVLLTIMAVDNETEDMLDYICLHASDTFVSELAQYGIYHLQPMARWQIAELIGRRKPLRWKDMLYVLIEDHDEYVVKRAKNAICYP